MTPYQEAKYSLEGKAIEIASQLRSMEEQIDTVQKVNIYLMRKYRDELLAEFGDLAVGYKETCASLFGEKPPKEFEDALVIRHLYDKIAEVRGSCQCLRESDLSRQNGAPAWL